MLLVREMAGPSAAKAGDRVTYRVTRFSGGRGTAAAAAGVHWLIKTSDGGALLSERDVGPVLDVTVPPSWSGLTIMVMPYMRSPSTAVAARPSVGARAPIAGGVRQVEYVREGSRYYATVDEQPRFYVGTDVRYHERRGLMNSPNPPGPRYRAEDYEAVHGDWAWYLLPTITAESRRYFTCLNSYDIAGFTFGHMQLGAHTPNDNFVLVLREMLALPLAASYFPDLTVDAGRVQRRTNGGAKPLESARSTRPLMEYFNPTEDRVDGVEVERAARIVDWCVADPALRDLTVDFAVRQQRRKLAFYATKLPLDGVVDKLCLVVIDILHQGRAGFASIKKALAAADPFDSLLGLGASSYAERIATLRAEIRGLEEDGRVGRKVYDRRAADFVVPRGA
jgi:hypothetical protein